MNDNYLWDRTGEPDTDVRELEELLGTLRYEPRRLEIPAALKIQTSRRFIPLAIAAAIALMIAAGLLLRFAHPSAQPAIQVKAGSPSAPVTTQAALPVEEAIATSTPPSEAVNPPRHMKPSQAVTARNLRRPIPTAPAALTQQELAEKEQVLVALRLVSAKLNLAQRKAQGLPQVNAIRNQHKIG
jgi:hypothetical protein